MVLGFFAIMLNRSSAHDWLRNSGLCPIATPEVCHGISQSAPKIYEHLSQQSEQVLQKPPGILLNTYFIMRICSAIIISLQFISESLAHFLSGQSSSKSTP